jgi:ribosomal protein S27E
MRQITVDCDVCGTDIPLEQSKEALIKEEAPNAYHLYDLCASCLDEQLKSASAVNDTDGFRQKAAALITPKDGRLPERKAS